jgi:hypothetical protein
MRGVYHYEPWICGWGLGCSGLGLEAQTLERLGLASFQDGCTAQRADRAAALAASCDWQAAIADAPLPQAAASSQTTSRLCSGPAP